MISTWLLNSARTVLAISILLPAAAGQTQSSAQNRSQRRKYEDDVARLFEVIRAKDELPRLTRIPRRDSLEELVCSAASLNAPVWQENRPGALMYKTDNPASPSQELEKIALYKDPLESTEQPGITRYSVAVWPSSNQESGQPVYWVGIQVYMSAWWELIDSNFTDNRSHRDEWKKLVTPACRRSVVGGQ
jgi:hypothetical protein